MELSIYFPGMSLMGKSKSDTSDMNQCFYLSEEKGKLNWSWISERRYFVKCWKQSHEKWKKEKKRLERRKTETNKERKKKNITEIGEQQNVDQSVGSELKQKKDFLSFSTLKDSFWVLFRA